MLYVVATPIGNLEDITLRAISTLKSVDFILSEDTRVTQKLLNYFDISTPTISFHEYSDQSKYEKILDLLEKGKDLALVTDAGTPAISDPGYFLVQTVREKLPEVKISPIPGASALTALVSVSGINMKEFTFLGFPPHKKGRKTFFENVVDASQKNPVIFYESKHRIIKALESLEVLIPNQKIVIGREMTKIFEEIISGTVEEVREYFSENPSKLKGEFVIIVS
jgi:16S rRNA (cytidine1402-2'-O)-methyltransferase